VAAACAGVMCTRGRSLCGLVRARARVVRWWANGGGGVKDGGGDSRIEAERREATDKRGRREEGRVRGTCDTAQGNLTWHTRPPQRCGIRWYGWCGIGRCGVWLPKPPVPAARGVRRRAPGDFRWQPRRAAPPEPRAGLRRNLDVLLVECVRHLVLLSLHVHVPRRDAGTLLLLAWHVHVAGRGHLALPRERLRVRGVRHGCAKGRLVGSRLAGRVHGVFERGGVAGHLLPVALTK